MGITYCSEVAECMCDTCIMRSPAKSRNAGRVEERAAIVAWLTNHEHAGTYLTHPSWVQEVAPQLAEQIQRGKHMPKGDG